MTSFDQMAYNDPVGAAACADAGRFGEPNPAPRPDPFDPETRCSYCDNGSGRVTVAVDDEYAYIDACPVCQPDEDAPPVVPTFLPYPWSAP